MEGTTDPAAQADSEHMMQAESQQTNGGEAPSENPSFFSVIGARREVDCDTSETSSYQSSADRNTRPECTQPPVLNQDEVSGLFTFIASLNHGSFLSLSSDD